MSLRTIAAGVLTASLLFAGAFVVQAAPQEDSPGVTVNQTGLLHRAPVKYPPQALSKNIEGDVVVEAVVNQKGAVTEARVISGPEELRNAALSSVLQWHFANGPGRVPVTIGFSAHKRNAAVPPERKPQVPAASAAADKDMGVLKSIQYDNVPEDLRAALASHVPAHEGDLVSSDLMERAVKAALETDEHVQVKFQRDAIAGGAVLRLSLPGAASINIQDRPVKVNGKLQATRIREMRRPQYPPEAKLAMVQGLVRLNAVIGLDGKVKSLTVTEGEPLLAAAAMEAVKDWVYQPMAVNGQVAEVMTEIDVNFTLSK